MMAPIYPLNKDVKIFRDQKSAGRFLIEQWRQSAREAINRKGWMATALSGGQTPVSFYAQLAHAGLPWDNIHVFLVDERFVPPDHPDSNVRMIRQSFLLKAGLPPGNIHAVPFLTTTQESAAAYEDDIKVFFKITAARQRPVFDLILLGVGEDGHTASLFPGGPGLAPRSRTVVPVQLRHVKHSRISLSLGVLNHAQACFFLVMGQKKSVVIKDVIENRKSVCPAARVRPVSGRLVYIMDREAARSLKPSREASSY